MEEKIKVQFNNGKNGLREYATDNVFKSTAWLIAVENGFENDLAKEIVNLSFEVWLDIDESVSEIKIIEYVCENHEYFDGDYKEISRNFITDVLGVW